MHTVELAGLGHRRYPLADIAEDLGRPSSDVVFDYAAFHVYREVEVLSVGVHGATDD